MYVSWHQTVMTVSVNRIMLCSEQGRKYPSYPLNILLSVCVCVFCEFCLHPIIVTLLKWFSREPTEREQTAVFA